MEEKKILLVEDEEHLQKTIQLNLELEGYTTLCAGNGIEALKIARSKDVDLIVLDVMLPEMSGFEVCEVLRSEKNMVPILFLTAKGEGHERVKGLKLGADDYLSKPFNLEELLLRIHLLLTKSRSEKPNSVPLSYSFSGNKIDFSSYNITTHNKQSIQLGKKEIELLKLLILRKGEVVSREEILNTIWGENAFPTTRTIDNYILVFRKYFEPNPREPKHFHSVRSVGYKFSD
jgi:two-component system, OmpR family, alkaline phosphatase synthesis response regulator PhoP